MINIVLYQPEKPANTGNIVRTCMCFDMKLHIIGPITFSFDDKYLKRAEMDYVKDCDISFYDSYEDFLSKNFAKNSSSMICNLDAFPIKVFHCDSKINKSSPYYTKSKEAKINIFNDIKNQLDVN